MNVRKHISIPALFLRQRAGAFAGLLALMAAVNSGGFYLIGFHREWSFASGECDRYFAVVFGCAVLVAFVLSLGGGSELTLGRLSVSERGIFLWQSAAVLLRFFLLWSVEVLSLLLLGWLYAGSGYSIGVFFDFYRRPFLHAALPLADAAVWVRNGIFLVGLAVAAAEASLLLRRHKKTIGAMVLLALMVTRFPAEVGSSPWFDILAAASLTAWLGWRAWRLARTGKPEAEDEEA